MLTALRKSVAAGLVSVAKRIEPATADLAPFAFDPAFVGNGWEVRNPNSLPSDWSPRDLKWVATPLHSGETSITGAENKTRLADAGIHLRGVEAFSRCWKNRRLIPEELKDKLVFFDGDGEEVLLSPRGFPFSLYLCWYGDEWFWNYRWLDDGRGARCVSASASWFLASGV